MHIGFLIYGSLDTLSGGYLYDRKLVEYLRAQGDTVDVISLPWRNYAAHITDNLRFRLPPSLDLLIQDELNHPSLISANRRRRSYPVISLVHHLRCSERRAKWQNAFYRVIERRYLNSVDGFIFNSKTTEKVVNSLTRNRRPSVVAYPPTDRFGDAISEKEVRARAPAGPLRILFLGNVIERKGLHTLLKALNSRIPAYSLDVVGSLDVEPAYARKMQQFVRANRLAPITHFHGPLGPERLKSKLQQAHILIVPSSYEGFGIAYLEGMGFGLPAIGTTAGAAGEVIEHEKTGYLIEPGDHQALGQYLTALSKDRALLEKLSLNARSRYNEQPSWNDTVGQIRTFLQSMT